MKLGWHSASLDFDDLLQAIANGFCSANGIDRTKHRIRVGLHAKPPGPFGTEPSFTATVEWKEEAPRG